MLYCFKNIGQSKYELDHTMGERGSWVLNFTMKTFVPFSMNSKSVWDFVALLLCVFLKEVVRIGPKRCAWIDRNGSSERKHCFYFLLLHWHSSCKACDKKDTMNQRVLHDDRIYSLCVCVWRGCDEVSRNNFVPKHCKTMHM